MTWTVGRKLETFGDNISYKYNSLGHRITKTVGDTVHEYFYKGNRLIKEVRTDADGTVHTLVFLYDASDSPVGMQYDGTAYYYKKNLQGDVIALLDANCNTIAEYVYDAWGALRTIEANEVNTAIAEANPIRYRGYYYDSETGFYFLQSRYYDPVVGRFLNCDAIEILLVPIDVSSANIYSYCENNPINSIDVYGFKKISVTWIEPTVNLILALIPMIWAINKVLRGGRAIVKTLIELSKLIVRKGKEIIKKLDDWLYRQFATTIGYELAKIIGSGIISIISVFLSVGGIVQYAIDCLDGKWDDYIDTTQKLKLRIVLKRG